jgi:multicomponent Na+:H+ antiporter subunit B
MIQGHDSVVVRTTVRLLMPWIQIFALYVLFHGHGSPGGGFQGGVIMAAAYILVGLGLGREELDRLISEAGILRWAAVGVLAYLTIGIAALAGAGSLLDYAALPVPGLPAVRLRYLGILAIEAGVFVAVAAALVLIFLRLARSGEGEQA